MYEVREETPADATAVATVLSEAFLAEFGSDSEVGLVESMRALGELLADLALVADDEGDVVGFIAFSEVTIDGVHAGTLGLGPVAVRPGLQRGGIGSALIDEGLRRARSAGWRAVVLLGHETYYPRFGFRPAAPLGVRGEYGDHAGWMVLSLDGDPPPAGLVLYCSSFRDL